MNHRIHSYIFDSILIFLIFFAPAAVGAVHVRTGALLTIGVALLFLIHLSKRMFSGNSAGSIVIDIFSEKGLFVLFLFSVFFLFLILIQLVPFPQGFVDVLSPRAGRFYESAKPFLESVIANSDSNSFRTISLYPYATKEYLVLYLTYLFTFFVVTIEIREKQRIRRIIVALIVAGFLQSLYGLYSYFSKDYYIFGYRVSTSYAASGTFINRNHYVAFLSMIFPLSLGYFLMMVGYGNETSGGGLKRKIHDFFTFDFTPWKGILVVMIVVMIPGILFSLSRMGVFSFIVSLGFMGIMALLKRRKKSTAALLLVLVAGIGLSLWYGLRPLEGRYLRTFESMDDLRYDVWKRTVQYAKDFLVTGSGPGTYEYVYRMYEDIDRKESSRIMNHAHNDYLELLAELGLPGLIAALGAGVFFSSLLLGEWIKRKNAFAIGVGLGGAGALIYMALHSVTDFNFHIPANGFIFFIVAAISYRGVKVRGFPVHSGTSTIPFEQEERSLPANRIRFVGGWAVAVLIVFISGYMTLFSLKRWRAESIYPVERNTLRETRKGEIPVDEDLPELEKAAAFLPDLLEYRLLLGKYYLYGVDWRNLQESEKKKVAGEAKEQFASVLAMNPLITEAFTDLSRIDFAFGNVERGLERLDRSVELSRGDYYSRAGYGMTIATYYHLLEKRERPLYLARARWELHESMKLNPLMKKNPSIAIALARIYILEGDTKMAIRTLEMLKDSVDENGLIAHRLLLARLYLHSGQELRALSVYEQINKGVGQKARTTVISALKGEARRYPNLIRLRIYLGMMLLAGGESGATLGLFSSGEKFAGLPAKERADAFFMLGEANESEGDLKEALRNYRNSLQVVKSHEKSKLKILELVRKGVF